MAQQQERAPNWPDDALNRETTGQTEVRPNQLLHDPVQGMGMPNALSHSGPPALVRPSSIARAEQHSNAPPSVKHQHIDETSSVISFTSSVHSLNYDSASVTSSSSRFNNPLGLNVHGSSMMSGRAGDISSKPDQNQILSSLKYGNDVEKLSKDLLAMSSSPANYTRMRTIPVISSMVQLLHQSIQIKCDPIAASLACRDNFANRQSRDVRARVARALHNTVHINQLSKHYKKEGKVLRLLENLRMYADVLRDLTLSLKGVNKEEDEESKANNHPIQDSELTTLEEKERMIDLLGNCNSIKVATVRNLSSPTGKDLVILCNCIKEESNPNHTRLGDFLFKFPCRNFVNYSSESPNGIHEIGCEEDDARDVDSGIISMEDTLLNGSIMDAQYRDTLITKFETIKNFWISINIEETMAWLTKWSFDEGHRQPIELLGGIQALAEFVQIEWEAHQYMSQTLFPGHDKKKSGNQSNHSSSTKENHTNHHSRRQKSKQSCIEVRRYAVVALTNMTFGKANIKSFLCTFPGFIRLMVGQLAHEEKVDRVPQSSEGREIAMSSIENLRKATAHLFRNLAWKADKNSKQILSESEVVRVLLRSAIDVTIASFSVVEKRSISVQEVLSSRQHLPRDVEPFLKVILSALWNLSAHCRKNKSDICEMDCGLQFLVFLLGQSQSAQIIESSGGILRNISSFIATSPSTEKYRQQLRHSNCLQVLLQQLKSSSLTIVSNACGTLWNFSARNEEDQRSLWDLGAVPMLESLTKSKHKTISTCSSAALKNLYGFEEKQNDSRSMNGSKVSHIEQDDQHSAHSQGQQSNSQNTLEKRKKKHKAKELDEILKANLQPQVQDEDKDSCTSCEDGDSDSESWNIERRHYPSDLISRDDVSQGGVSSRLSNISASKSISASNDGRANSQLSNKELIVSEDSHSTQVEQVRVQCTEHAVQQQRAYSTAQTNFSFSQRDQFSHDQLRSPSFSVPGNSGMSPVLSHNPLQQRPFDGRFTNFMKQYQPQAQNDLGGMPSNAAMTHGHQSSFPIQQNSQTSFNELLSPSKLPHLSFNATTSSPLYSTQNNMRQNDSFGNRVMYEENNDDCIDECPTDYSLRFQENEETELMQGIQRNVHTEEVCISGDEERNNSNQNEEDEPERNGRACDDVKTYCIEETPYDTPCVISHAGSVTDLREGDNQSSGDEGNEPTNQNPSTIGMNKNSMPITTANTYRNYQHQDDDDMEDDEESNGPKVFCTEDTPGIFSRADSISSLSSEGDDMMPNELERQQVIQRGRSIENQGEFASLNANNILSPSEVPEKGELETNCSLQKEKFEDEVSPDREVSTPPLVSGMNHTSRPQNEARNLKYHQLEQTNNDNGHQHEYNPHTPHNKHVKFNPQETPLMYSRASSPESLASCDIDDGYKDVYSSYEPSRATSGRVSPSDLPDSPCQSRPRSPPLPLKTSLSNKKPQQTMQAIRPSPFLQTNTTFSTHHISSTETIMNSGKKEERNKRKAIRNEENRNTLQGEVSQNSMHSQNQKEECEEEEDAVKCYAVEGETPACFSPMSRLTFSDEEKEGQKQREFDNHNTSNSKVKCL